MLLAAAILLTLQSPPSDEEAATKVCETYFAAMKKGDFEAGADCMHPKSLKKVHETFVNQLKNESEKVRNSQSVEWGFKDWGELMSVTDRAFFVRFLKKSGEMGQGADISAALAKGETRTLGALKGGDKVYVVAEMTFTLAGEKQVVPLLNVLYRDGGRWKLANRNETNIGN